MVTGFSYPGNRLAGKWSNASYEEKHITGAVVKSKVFKSLETTIRVGSIYSEFEPPPADIFFCLEYSK